MSMTENVINVLLEYVQFKIPCIYISKKLYLTLIILLKITGHDDDVNAVAFADNSSQILYSAGDDGVCKVWDRRTLSESHPKPVGCLAGALS